MSFHKIPVAAVVGPTASGKTALAVRLAERFGGEVLSGDSMQVYRGMDIGTAKPTEEEKRGIPHHLIDIADPWETYSVARYVKDAAAAAESVSAKGRLPIVCGGTGLYIDSFLKNIPFPEQEDTHPMREKLYREYEADGGKTLFRELEKGDPQTAAKIHINNAVKLVRAVEMLRSGQSVSDRVRAAQNTESPYIPLYIGLRFQDRGLLYERIEKRVDSMMSAGLEEEARRLKNMSPPISATASAAIGYKEMFAYLDGHMTREDAVAEVKKATRRYAKRQMTWFGRNADIKWIDGALPFEEICKIAEKYMEIFSKM